MITMEQVCKSYKVTKRNAGFGEACKALFRRDHEVIHALHDVSFTIDEGEMAHARFYSDEIRKQMPKCSYRKYTISEIINSVINSGFTLKRFDEHPAWANEKVPGEFTVIARK